LADSYAQTILRWIGSANFPKASIWKPRYDGWAVDPYMAMTLKDPEVPNGLKQKHLPESYDRKGLDFMELKEKELFLQKGVKKTQQGYLRLWGWMRLWFDLAELIIWILTLLGYFKEDKKRMSGSTPKVAAEYANFSSVIDVHSWALQIVGERFKSGDAQPFFWVTGAKKKDQLYGMARRAILW
jgi:hypothetical protein